MMKIDKFFSRCDAIIKINVVEIIMVVQDINKRHDRNDFEEDNSNERDGRDVRGGGYKRRFMVIENVKDVILNLDKQFIVVKDLLKLIKNKTLLLAKIF